MTPPPELITAAMQDRARSLERERLARLATCLRDCTSPSTFRRVARVLRREPAGC
ncbi:MAG TPA: hypothetical protein VFP22_05320 [Candidatus Limnocylindrales bacterium]|nr:hypothetical protein [Candidatus Limnocylindrales bacterium]